METSDPEEAVSSSRRPMNAFLLFCKRHRAIVKEKYPNLENRNITKILGEWWQSLGDSEKAVFNSLASEYKEHVMREQPNFRWRKPPNPSAAPNTHLTKSQTGAALAAGLQNTGDAAPTINKASNDTVSSRIAQEDNNGSSNSSSISSSPEPSVVQAPSATVPPTASNAPKPFKKRYLAAEKAKMVHSGSDLPQPVSPEAEHACKALLELAGVRESSPAEGCVTMSSRNGSRSGTSSPPSRDPSSQSKPQGFDSLRDAVWGRVARTLLKQEEEKGNSKHEDTPLNLSSQCTIQGQTIIEHIIENILDTPILEGDTAVTLDNNSSATNGGGDNRSSLNGGGDDTVESIKDKIYQGLKQDMLNRAPGTKEYKDRSALWKLLPHDNIVTINSTKSNPGRKPVENKPKEENKKSFPTLKQHYHHQQQPSGFPTGIRPKSVSPPSSFVVDKSLPPLPDRRETLDDTSKLNIKQLLAQSPTPLSPRSKTPSASSASLTNAVIASVLQNQQLFLQHRKPPPPVSVTLVTNSRLKDGSDSTKPLNLSTSPPQTPSVSLTPIIGESSFSTTTLMSGVTITTTTVSPTKRKNVSADEESASPTKRKVQNDEEEEETRRSSSRSCKGRRYQEFKDEGRLGKKGTVRKNHKSGDSHVDDQHQNNSNSSNPLSKHPSSEDHRSISPPDSEYQLQPAAGTTKTNTQQQLRSPLTFDVSAKLSEIPALSLDAYQQKVVRAKSLSTTSSSPSSSSSSSTSACVNGQYNADQESDVNKRKTRRTGVGGGGASAVMGKKKSRGANEIADLTVSS